MVITKAFGILITKINKAIDGIFLMITKQVDQR